MRKFKTSHSQTKFFIFTLALYMLALFWTTFQAYARLDYSRSDRGNNPIIIHIPEKPEHS